MSIEFVSHFAVSYSAPTIGESRVPHTEGDEFLTFLSHLSGSNSSYGSILL